VSDQKSSSSGKLQVKTRMNEIPALSEMQANFLSRHFQKMVLETIVSQIQSDAFRLMIKNLLKDRYKLASLISKQS